MSPTPSLETALSTTLNLLDQFTINLTAQSNTSAETTTDGPSPLPLLQASSTSLRAQTTKLSLLTINTPFTPSAISSVLSAVNESILPSLVTGALLTTSEKFTSAFASECLTLVRTTLRDFKVLIEDIADRKKSSTREIKDDEKKHVTETTGRIWDGCDNLITLSREGVAGFMVKKAKEYEGLIKDAIQELEEWDPEDDDDEDIFGSSDDEDEPNGTAAKSSSTDADVIAQKATTLQLLKRVPQTLHVLVKYGPPFAKNPQSALTLSRGQTTILNTLLSNLQNTSAAVDEVVGALYEQDVVSTRSWGDEVKKRMVDSVDCCLADTWSSSGEVAGTGKGKSVTAEAEASEGSTAAREETKGEKYLTRAREWIQSVETAGKSSPIDKAKDPK